MDGTSQGPICIESDSDDEDDFGAEPSVPLSRQRPLPRYLPASLVIREAGRGWTPSAGSRSPLQTVEVGKVEVWPVSGTDGNNAQTPNRLEIRMQVGTILQKGRPAAPGKRLQVPAHTVRRLEVQPVEKGASQKMIVLGLDPPMLADSTHRMLGLQSPAHIPGDGAGTSPVTLVHELGLQPPEGGGKSTLETLRQWLPQVKMTKPNKALDGKPAPLRLNGITLGPRDLALLREGQFLNDSILDFFLRLAVDAVAPPDLRSNFYVASTLFFQKLTAGGAENGEEGFQNVRTWTRALAGGLLAHEYVALPVNEANLHWWLAVLCYPCRALEQAPQNGSAAHVNGDVPRIVCLDSAPEPPPKEGAMDFIKGYLWREWRERQADRGSARAGRGSRQGKDLTEDTTGTEHVSATDIISSAKAAQSLQAVVAQVPMQENGYDCGVFVIEFLVHLIRSRASRTGLGLAPHLHWFGQEHVSHRRQRFRWITWRLQQVARARQEPDVAKLLLDDNLRKEVARAMTDTPSGQRILPEVEPETPGPCAVETPQLQALKRPRLQSPEPPVRSIAEEAPVPRIVPPRPTSAPHTILPENSLVPRIVPPRPAAATRPKMVSAIRPVLKPAVVPPKRFGAPPGIARLQQRNQAMPTMAARATYLQPHLKQREHVQDNNVLDDTVEGITTDVAGKETHIESYESFDQDIEEAESAAEMDVNQFVQQAEQPQDQTLDEGASAQGWGAWQSEEGVHASASVDFSSWGRGQVESSAGQGEWSRDHYADIRTQSWPSRVAAVTNDRTACATSPESWRPEGSNGVYANNGGIVNDEGWHTQQEWSRSIPSQYAPTGPHESEDAKMAKQGWHHLDHANHTEEWGRPQSEQMPNGVPAEHAQGITGVSHQWQFQDPLTYPPARELEHQSAGRPSEQSSVNGFAAMPNKAEVLLKMMEYELKTEKHQAPTGGDHQWQSAPASDMNWRSTPSHVTSAAVGSVDHSAGWDPWTTQEVTDPNELSASQVVPPWRQTRPEESMAANNNSQHWSVVNALNQHDVRGNQFACANVGQHPWMGPTPLDAQSTSDLDRLLAMDPLH